MYYFRNVSSGAVVTFANSDGGDKLRLGLEKDEGKAIVLVLMRIGGNRFRIGVNARGGPLYLSSLGAEDGSAVSLSDTIFPDSCTKFFIEGGMSLRITDIRYHTANARIRILPPLICFVSVSVSRNDKQSESGKKTEMTLNLPRAKGIWRNGLGYGVGPQAVFDTGLPYVIWTGADSGTSTGSGPSVEIGKSMKNAGWNAVFGEKDLDYSDVLQGVSLRNMMENKFEGKGLELEVDSDPQGIGKSEQVESTELFTSSVRWQLSDDILPRTGPSHSLEFESHNVPSPSIHTSLHDRVRMDMSSRCHLA